MQRLIQLPRQLMRRSPFKGDITPSRVAFLTLGSSRPCRVPVPHPWNYQQPIQLLATYFHDAEALTGSARHNRYLDTPGFMPVLVTRDPGVIRAISTETGDKPGMFDRDTLPSRGIARATGPDTLLYANGEVWKQQKRLSTPPFGRTSLFQPERFAEFAETFRTTIRKRIDAMRQRLSEQPGPVQVALEPEIQVIMLEMLVNNFFGAEVPYEQIRDRYAPALAEVIDYIVTDTVVNRIGLSRKWMEMLSARARHARKAQDAFEELTDHCMATRKEGKGQWKQFQSDAPDELLRSNIRVFLAGALEATTSFASWAISHLARNAAAQERVFEEVKEMTDYQPEHLRHAKYLMWVLDETLRLTPSLYFHPRRPTVDTWIETTDGRKLWIPRGTHILLDIWHANRHEDHWGQAVTGYPADQFVPERWDNISREDRGSKDMLHFGFGHGPRFCPGKHLGLLEVALVVGAFVKVFRCTATTADNPPRAGVSTKPADGTLVNLQLREAYANRVGWED